MPRIDVVVVTYNSAEHIRACVEPLCADDGISVIVVDNNSSDATLDVLAPLPLTVIRREDNRGFAFGCNAGWRAGAAPSVVFLNPDSQADPGAILALADRLEGEPPTGIVGPTIVDERGSVYLSQRRFASFAISLAAAFFVPRLRPATRWSLDVADDAAYRRPGTPDWVSGACLAIRRELLEETDGFDEGFFMYYEDMDLCRRARDAGAEVRYDPSIRVIHVGGASAPRARLIPVMTRSRLRYARKHHGRRGELLERLATALHSLTHVALTTQGGEARRGYLAALRTALTPGDT